MQTRWPKYFRAFGRELPRPYTQYLFRQEELNIEAKPLQNWDPQIGWEPVCGIYSVIEVNASEALRMAIVLVRRAGLSLTRKEIRLRLFGREARKMGMATIPEARRKEISRLGGWAAHQPGANGYEFSSIEACIAGSKGSRVSCERRRQAVPLMVGK